MMEDIHRFAKHSPGAGNALWSDHAFRAAGMDSSLEIAGSPATLLHHSRRPAASRRATSEPRSGCQDRADQAEAGMNGSFDSSWGCIRHAGVVVMVEFDALLGDIIPRWRDLFDVLKGALEMQIRIGTLGKSVAVFGVAVRYWPAPSR